MEGPSTVNDVGRDLPLSPTDIRACVSIIGENSEFEAKKTWGWGGRLDDYVLESLSSLDKAMYVPRSCIDSIS